MPLLLRRKSFLDILILTWAGAGVQVSVCVCVCQGEDVPSGRRGLHSNQTEQAAALMPVTHNRTRPHSRIHPATPPVCCVHLC